MRLNLVLSARDLGHTRLAISPLQNLIIGFWRHQPLRQRLHWQRIARRHVTSAAAPFLELVNAHPWYVPDFLTPVAPSAREAARVSIADELEVLRAVTDTRIHTDREDAESWRGVRGSVLNLRESGTHHLGRIVDAARVLFDSCLADDWPTIRHRLQTDVTHRAALMASTGSMPMLTGLSTRLSWRGADTLSVACDARVTPSESTISMSGHGLLLMPSPFTGPGTVDITGSVTASRQAVIAYSAIAAPPAAAGKDPLAALVGRGRARALRAIGGKTTTGDLARRLGIAASTASEHATALRAAGLVTTHRTGRSVHHTITDLGRRLLLHDPSEPPATDEQRR